MSLNRIVICLYIVFGLVIIATAQDVDLLALQKEFPKKDIVFLNYDSEVNVSVKDGELVISESISRSKIFLTERAKLYEEESIYYYDANSITEIEASSRVPKGSRYKTHKVKDFKTIETISERYFYDDSYAIKFNYPEMREGVIGNVSYTHQIDNPIFMPMIFLANYFPIKEMNIKIVVDEKVDLLIHEFNLDQPIDFKTTEKGGKTIYEFTQKNIARVDIEERGKSFQAVVPHIALAVASYEAGGKTHKVMGNLDDLFQSYSNFISEVDTTIDPVFEAKVDSITASSTTELEKVSAIYHWVKKNIKYIAFEDNMGGFIPRNPQTVFDRKFGDCKDMSSIIVKMLDVQGIKGHYAWVGTRDLPYKYSDACGTFIDNHMIAVYHHKESDRYYYLDATNEYLPFGLVPPHIQEKQVMIYLGPSNYKILDAGITQCQTNLNSENCRLRIEDSKLTGHFDIYLGGYKIPDYKYIFADMSTKSLEKRYQTYFAKGSNKSTLTNINPDHDVEPLKVSYDIVISDYIALAADEIYVNMNLDKLFEDQKIPASRKQSIDFQKTHYFTKNYILEIPEGHTVTYIPEEVSFGDEDYSCSIKYIETDTEISYQFELCLNILWLESEDFPKWNTFIKQLKKAYRENIILTKK